MMPERPPPDRLDADVIAAYLDGQLSSDEKAAVEAHLAADPETYAWVTNAMRVIDEMGASGSSTDSSSGVPDVNKAPRRTVVPMPPPPRPPFYRQRTVRAVMSGVLAAAAAVLLVVQIDPAWWRQLTGRDQIDPRFAKLVAAVGEERYIEGRLSGGFHYGPLRSATRGPGDLSNQNLALLAAAGELQKAAQADPSAENLHAWGVAQVLLGDWNGAVTSLDDALTVGGESPKIMTTLSAALIARGDALDRTEDHARALSLATRALEREPSSLSALFNRGLALSKLHLAREAVSAWDRYLSLEADSPWSREAARHRAEMLETLQQSGRWQRWEPPPVLTAADGGVLEAAVATAPDRARLWLDTILLPALARTTRADTRDWRSARIVADSLERLTGDPMPAAMLADIERLPSVTDRHAAAHDAFADATRAQARGLSARFREAVQRLEQVELHDLPSLTQWRTVFRAQVAIRERRYEEAGRVLDEWLASDAVDVAPMLAARAAWAHGLSLANRSDHAGALAAFHRARDLFERVRDTASLGRLESQLAAMYSLLGSEWQAWRHRRRALGAAAVTEDPLLQDAIYNNVFVTVLDGGLLDTAEAFLTALNDAATRGEMASSRLQAVVRRGWLDYRRGRVDETREHLRDAVAQLASIDDESVRLAGRSMVTVLAAAVDLQRGDAPAVLAGVNDDSLANARTMLERATLLLLRSSARQRLDDVEGSEADLRAAVNIAGSSYRGEANLGLPEFDRDLIWSGLERFVDVALQRNEAASALAAVDAVRRRLSALPVDGPDHDRLDALRQATPEDTAILYCVPFASRTAAWVVTSRAVHAEWLAVGADEIASHHARALRHIQQRDDVSAVAVFAALGKRLIEPLDEHLSAARRLRVIADGALATVPFGLLTTTGGRLQARHMISYAAVLPRHEDRPADTGTLDALIIGDPAFDPHLFPGLTRLSGARREGRAISASYARAVVLEGSEATTPAVIEALTKRPRVVHFAGHAVADAQQPLASSLLLSPVGGEVGALPLRRLLPALVGNPIVVLAACSTARAFSSRLSPTVTFASGLVAAGASAVVGTLWDLPDGEVSPAIRQLHDALAAGEPPAAALARAQTAAERAGSGLLGWAGLVVYERGM